MQIHLVPYSEHSSYLELREYVKFLKPQEVLFLLNRFCTVRRVQRIPSLRLLLLLQCASYLHLATCAIVTLCSSYRQWGAAVARRP